MNIATTQDMHPTLAYTWFLFGRFMNTPIQPALYYIQRRNQLYLGKLVFTPSAFKDTKIIKLLVGSALLTTVLSNAN